MSKMGTKYIEKMNSDRLKAEIDSLRIELAHAKERAKSLEKPTTPEIEWALNELSDYIGSDFSDARAALATLRKAVGQKPRLTQRLEENCE